MLGAVVVSHLAGFFVKRLILVPIRQTIEALGKLADGKFFVQERIAQVKAKGSGTIEYRWTNQNTKKVELKVAYFEAVPGMNLFLNCAYYK